MLTTLRGILRKFSQFSQLSIDDVSFVFCMLLNVPVGVLYRKALHPRNVPPTWRLAGGLIWGIAIASFCFGRYVVNLVAMTALCYVLTCIVHPTIVHRCVFVISFACLSLAQLYRMITEYGMNRFDYTVSLMLMTQKFTYVAFSLHDGLARDDIKLSDEQRREKIKRVPSVLEYFAYLFHYSMLFAGPVCTFKEYMDFIEGKDINVNKNNTKKSEKEEPSPLRAALAKFLESIMFGLLVAKIAPRFPIEKNGDPDFTAKSPLIWRVLYAWISLVLFRCRYYFGFAIAETSNIVSGLGFNGYDKKGRPLWNKLPCVNALSVEFGTSMKMAQDNWNIFTLLWLRRIVKDRFNRYSVFYVYLTSAVWHGFYPVYYAAAPSMLMATYSARALRRTFKPFVDSLPRTVQTMASVLTWVMALNMISYSFVPFAMLRFDLGVQFLRSMYFYGHIACFVILLTCHSMRKPKGACAESTTRDKKVITNGFLSDHVSSNHHSSNSICKNCVDSKRKQQ